MFFHELERPKISLNVLSVLELPNNGVIGSCQNGTSCHQMRSLSLRLSMIRDTGKILATNCCYNHQVA